MTGGAHATKPASSSWWTEARVEQLRKLYADGIGPSEIARIMVAESRSVVIGKAHRLGLVCIKSASGKVAGADYPQPGPHIQSQAQPRPMGTVRATVDVREPAPAKPRSEPKPPTPLTEFAASAGAITIHELSDNRCHFPLGEPRTEKFRYCGADIPRAVRDRGLCYCFDHVRMAYQGGTAAGPTTARPMREVE